MNTQQIKEKIKAKLSTAQALGAVVCFDFGDDGTVFVDMTKTPAVLLEAHDDADLTVTTSAATFAAILEGTQDPNIAFMMGKLKVKGPMGLAMKLNTMLED